MRLIVLCFLFFSGICAKGQMKKNVSIPHAKYQQPSDTSYWFRSYVQLASKLKLPDLLQNKDSFHFRFWTDVQAIDIWSADNIQFQGTLTNFARQYETNPSVIEKIYQNQSALTPLQTTKIVQYLHTNEIARIPSDNSIKNWPQNGLDGNEFCIEFSDLNNYSFKEYWSPGFLKDSIPEAKKISDLADFLSATLQLREAYNSLKLPSDKHFLRNGIPGMQIRVQDGFSYPPTNKSVLETLQ